MKKVLLLSLLLMLMLSGCQKNSSILVFKRNIKYKVSGTATEFIIQYSDEKGANKMTSSLTEWVYEFKCKPETFVYLSAKNTTGTGEVKVEIFQGKDLLYQDINDIPYGVATISGFVK